MSAAVTQDPVQGVRELTGEDIDALPLTQYLVLDSLAGRERAGESLWTFPKRATPALRALASLGLVDWFSGSVQGTVRARLTDTGRALLLSPTYECPRDQAVGAYTFYPTGADPEVDPGGDLFFFTVRVERRTGNRWAVVNRGRVLTTAGKLVQEPAPDKRGKKFDAKYRFTREEALRRARELVDQVTVMGRTWPQYQAHMSGPGSR